MGLPAPSPGRLGPARHALEAGAELPDGLLRDSIRLSWARSRLAAAPMDRIDVPYRETDGAPERLIRAAELILGRFADQLTDTSVSIVLADAEARIVGRWAGDRSALHRLARLSIDAGFVLAEDFAGTNGVGTVLEERRPVTIFGEEHYSEPLHGLVCVGAPIRNPLTRRIEGVLDLACPISEATGLLVPTVLDLSSQIERELSSGSSARERIVFDEFMARSRETSAALIAVSERYMVTNAAAAELLDARDQQVLWDQVTRGDADRSTFMLANGITISARFKKVEIGSMLAGAIIELDRTPTPARGEKPAHPNRRPRGSGPVGGARTSGDQRTGFGVRPASGAARYGVRGRARGSGGARPADAPLVEELLARASGRVWLAGETGTGKLTRARLCHELSSPDEALTVRPAGLAAIDGPAAWLSSLCDRLADPRGAVILRNVEVLDAALSQGVADLLDQRQWPTPLVIATVATDRGAEPAGLRRRFGDAVMVLPPLRQRRSELPELIATVFGLIGLDRPQIGHRAMAALVNYSWPANFPELEQVLSTATRAAGGGAIGLEHLPDEVVAAGRSRRRLTRLELVEREAIALALRESGGNRAKAAAALGMSRSTFYRRLAVFGLDSARSLI